MDKKPSKPRAPTPKWKIVVLLVGMGLMAVGAYGLYAGFGKFGFLLPVFSGQAPPDDMGDQLDAAMSGSIFPLVVGFVGMMAGFIAVKVGMSPAKPKTVEQLVQEEVEKRMAELKLDASEAGGAVQILGDRKSQREPVASSAPAPQVVAQSSPVSVTAPATLSPAQPSAATRATATHCSTCGRPLLAGRFCRVCDAR